MCLLLLEMILIGAAAGPPPSTPPPRPPSPPEDPAPPPPPPVPVDDLPPPMSLPTGNGKLAADDSAPPSGLRQAGPLDPPWAPREFIEKGNSKNTDSLCALASRSFPISEAEFLQGAANEHLPPWLRS